MRFEFSSVNSLKDHLADCCAEDFFKLITGKGNKSVKYTNCFKFFV